jgi:hypothetical protein
MFEKNEIPIICLFELYKMAEFMETKNNIHVILSKCKFPLRIALSPKVTNLYFSNSFCPTLDKSTIIFEQSDDVTYFVNDNKSKIFNGDLCEIVIHADCNNLELVDFDRLKYVKNLTLNSTEIQKNLIFPKSLKFLNLIGDIYWIELKECLENNDLSDLTLILPQFRDIVLDNLPNNLKKLKINNIDYPLLNLPSGLESLIFEFTTSYRIDILSKCRIPYGCVVDILVKSPNDNTYDEIKELNLPFEYNYIFEV